MPSTKALPYHVSPFNLLRQYLILCRYRYTFNPTFMSSADCEASTAAALIANNRGLGYSEQLHTLLHLFYILNSRDFD